MALAAEHILEDIGVAGHVRCFVDRDESKTGAATRMWGSDVPIINIEALREAHENTVLLMTIEAFEAAIEALNRFVELDDVPCYVFAELNRDYIRNLMTHRYSAKTTRSYQRLCNTAGLGAALCPPR